jgi:hypothetical protein
MDDVYSAAHPRDGGDPLNRDIRTRLRVFVKRGAVGPRFRGDERIVDAAPA